MFLLFFSAAFFQQLKSQISQIDQNGFNPFCDKTLHMILMIMYSLWLTMRFLPCCLFDMCIFILHSIMKHLAKYNVYMYTLKYITQYKISYNIFPFCLCLPVDCRTLSMQICDQESFLVVWEQIEENEAADITVCRALQVGNPLMTTPWKFAGKHSCSDAQKWFI